METQTQTPSLRERALAAHRQQQAGEDEEERRQAEAQADYRANQIRRAYRRALGVEVSGEHARGMIDGLAFEAGEYQDQWVVQLVWIPCPRCGQERRSSAIFGLADLGAILEAGPGENHRCEPAAQPTEDEPAAAIPLAVPETPEQRLFTALAEWHRAQHSQEAEA